jgi:hypothetical protein
METDASAAHVHESGSIAGYVIEVLFNHGLYLPSGTALDERQLEIICASI